MRNVLIAAAISALSAVPLFIEQLFMPEADMLGAGIIFTIGQVIAAIMCLPRILHALYHHRESLGTRR